jgi:hypothetical protein
LLVLREMADGATRVDNGGQVGTAV